MPLAIKARSGAGSAIMVGNGGSPETFTTRLAQVMTIKLSGKKQNSEKVTNQDSAADPTTGIIYEELIGTIATGGTVDVTVNYVPTDASHKALMALFDGKAHNIQVVAPLDKTVSPIVPLVTWTIPVLLLDFPDRDLPLDKAMTLSLKFSVIGPDVAVYSQ